MDSALISGLVALVVAGTGALISLTQMQRERRKWVREFKVTWSIDLLRARLAAYPEAFRIIGRLSHGNDAPVTPQLCGEVAAELNRWLYSAGGMCAEVTTRAAILDLRHYCREWAEKNVKPRGFYDSRNYALAFLRLDLDLRGLEE